MASTKKPEEKADDTLKAGAEQTPEPETVDVKAALNSALKEIQEMKEAAAKEIQEMKAAVSKEIGSVESAAVKGKDAKAEKPLKSASETVLEAIKAEAMVPTQVTVPKIMGSRKPYQTTVLAKGMPDYHARIPRGVPVIVPFYVAQAIREDVLQNEKTEALVEKLTQEFLDKAKAITQGTI